MPLPKEHDFTSADYWNLPDGRRAELIGGQLYDMAPPSRKHQRLVMELSGTIRDYIRSHNGDCEVYPAPFAVDLDANDETWIEPDISVICDKSKLTDRGCKGAPDFIIEIVSPASRRMDYFTKASLYERAGVREYWIVDPMKEIVLVCRYSSDDVSPMFYPFTASIPVGIYPDLNITISELL